MYKHILLPTDGSKLAAKGVKVGVKLAKALRAKVTAKALGVVAAEARAAGVRYATETPTDNLPWQDILRVARSKKCDAIAMASQGRGGFGGLIIGSETARILAHSKIPVLVTR